MGKVCPVILTVYKDKSFTFEIKTPPAANLIMESIKIAKGSAQSNRLKMGSINWDQIKDIAAIKMPDLNCFTEESAMKMVAGTARSMGVTVSGKAPWEN
jgi:large subunit ribosomal protein L11